MHIQKLRGALWSAAAFVAVGLGISAFGPSFPTPVQAQAIPKSLEEGGTDAALRARKNEWTVGVVGGLLSGSYMTFADELAQVLDDGDNLRILPIVTHGAASNLDDLLYLRGVDVAMTQSDVFEYFRTQRKTVNLEGRINYIIRLPTSEMHVLARTDINSLADLRGKKVNFGPEGSASSLTGTIVFQRAGLQVEPTNYDNPLALQKLKSGEIAALVRVINKPIDFFAKIPANAGLHMVPIPLTKNYEDFYALGEFTSQEYPGLVPPGQVTDTIAVPAVLAVFNWQKNTDRYRKVQRFVEAFFTKFDQFQQPPRHPKWRDVNLAATVPGWTRWSVAEEMLQRLRQANAQTNAADAQPAAASAADFTAFLKGKGVASVEQQTPAQREALFREFLQWEQTRQRTSRQR
jgi:TRAP-type uncharacterized transport system substrate-binding protein